MGHFPFFVLVFLGEQNASFNIIHTHTHTHSHTLTLIKTNCVSSNNNNSISHICVPEKKKCVADYILTQTHTNISSFSRTLFALLMCDTSQSATAVTAKGE